MLNQFQVSEQSETPGKYPFRALFLVPPWGINDQRETPSNFFITDSGVSLYSNA
jgi:hypothetical protein